MILKVQVSLNDGGDRVLIYDRDRTAFMQQDATPAVRKIMGGRVKAFFEAEVKQRTDDVTIVAPAPDQDW